ESIFVEASRLQEAYLMIKPRLLYCLASSAIVLSAQGFHGGPFGGHGMMMAHESRTPVTGAPYSATMTIQSQRVLANGNQTAHNQQVKVSRDGRARPRPERTIPPPAASGKQPFTEVTIVDPVAGKRFVLNSATMTAFQSPLPPSRAASSEPSTSNTGSA